jgi:hypothetical protein
MIAPKRINARRGLFRIWIVVSAMWVLVVGIANWTQLSKIFVAIEPQAGQGAVSLPRGPYACWATRHSDNIFAFNDNNDDKDPAPTSLVDAWRQCLIYKMDVPMVALAPPLALLIGGSAVGWVIKGFRRS